MRYARKCGVTMKLVAVVATLIVGFACQGSFDEPTLDKRDADVDAETNPVEWACEGITCSGHGVCDDRSGEPLCFCFPGFHAEGLLCVADGPDGDADADTDFDADLDGDDPRDSDPDTESDVDSPFPGDWSLVPEGTFIMGSPPEERGRGHDEDQHEVILTRAFEIQTTEVTQEQFSRLMSYNPSRFADCPTCPVERVNWHEAAAYCNALSDEAGSIRCYECSGDGTLVRCAPREDHGNPYDCPGARLPTEAEFEHAARAGTTGPTYGDLDSVAWHADNADDRTHPVGGLEPNAFGLHDILGNVWEWCHDLYGEYPSGPVTDPAGAERGSLRVLRGGSWYRLVTLSRAASRNKLAPGSRFGNVGFRPVRSRAMGGDPLPE